MKEKKSNAQNGFTMNAVLHQAYVAISPQMIQ